MDYGEVITSAWKIIWKHKVLWLFGILGSCGGSAGSSNSGVSYQFNTTRELGLDIANFPSGWQLGLIIGLAAVLVLALIFLVIFLSTIGRIGLTLGTLQADQGAESLTIGGVFRGSTPYFWRVFFLNLLIVAAFVLIGLAIAAFLIVAAVFTLGLALLCLIPLLCLLIPLFWFVFVYVEQANVSLIVEDLNIGEALKRGWAVFWGNLGSMILIGLFVIAIAVVTGFLFSLPLSITLFPLILSLLRGGDLTNIGLVVALCFVIYLPVLFVLNGIVRTYLGSVWTLTFVRLTAGGQN